MPAVSKEQAEQLTQDKAKVDGKQGRTVEEKYYGKGKGRTTRTGPDGFGADKKGK